MPTNINAQRIVLSFGSALALGALALALSGMLTPTSTHAQTASSTSPMISSASATSNGDGTGASVVWTTDVPATSQVEYGTSTNYGTFSALDNTLVTNHMVTLAGLMPNTTYHFAVLSGGASSTATTTATTTVMTGTTTSSDLTFMTGSAATTTGSTTNTLAAPTMPMPMTGNSLSADQFTTASWSSVSGSSTPITYRYESSSSTSTNGNGSFTTPLFQSGVLTSPQISTSGTNPGTYYWHVQAVDNNGTMSPWSQTWSITVTNPTSTSTSTGTTTPPTTGGTLGSLITALQNLMNQFPQFAGQILGIINQLQSGNTIGNSAQASIDQANGTFRAGGTIDFVGRNFGHEETVRVMQSGSLVAAAHADGGGNFSTGSLTLPTTPGDYTYTFTGQTSGTSVTATIHLTQ